MQYKIEIEDEKILNDFKNIIEEKRYDENRVILNLMKEFLEKENKKILDKGMEFLDKKMDEHIDVLNRLRDK